MKLIKQTQTIVMSQQNWNIQADSNAPTSSSAQMPQMAAEPNIPLQSNLSAEELAYRAFNLKRIWTAYWQRERRYQEFNDMTYTNRYITNRKAAIAYIPPRLNADETEVVTGSVHQKILTLLSILKSYNYETNVTAYDKENRPYIELGKLMDDITNKVLKMDYEDEKETLILLEYLQQGDAFVLVEYKEGSIVKKEMTKEFDGKSADWKTTIEKLPGKIECTLIPGINFFFGNIRQHFVHKQPFVFTMEMYTYGRAKEEFGIYENFKLVGNVVKPFAPTTTYRDQSGEFFLFSNIKEGFVEVVKLYDKENNEYQIYANGIQLLPVKMNKEGKIEGFPLTEISPSGEYPIAKGSGEPLSAYFAYSKSMAEDSKVLVEIKDEMLKLFVLKTYQSYKPPMANLSNKEVSRNIYTPGKIINGLKPEQLQPILTPTGVTNAEIQAYNMISSLVDENSTAQIMSGESETGSQTATEIQAKRQQAMMKLGVKLAGYSSLLRQRTWLIIYLVLTKFTKVQDENIDEITGEIMQRYMTLVTEGTTESGRKAKKIIKFDKNKSQQSAKDTMVEENVLSDLYQQPVRLTYIHPEALKDTLRWIWDVKVTPTPEDTTELRKAQFKDSILFLSQIPPVATTINWDYVKEKLAVNEDLNPEELFMQQPQGTPGGIPLQQNGQPNLSITNALNAQNQVQQPSINAMQNQ